MKVEILKVDAKGKRRRARLTPIEAADVLLAVLEAVERPASPPPADDVLVTLDAPGNLDAPAKEHQK